MKLYYYNGKEKAINASNFGDELNPWLWDKLIPNLLNQDEQTLFVGIGTLLNEHLPNAPEKIIFGSGVGYGKTPKLDCKWNIYFVRGKLSANALGIDPEKGLTDPAILVRQFYKTSGYKKYKLSYMPHFTEAVNNGQAWQEICQSLNIYYISPRNSVEQILTEIDNTEILFAEAMHSAIVADALRVPWVAVKTKKGILDFKWQDWLSNLEITYNPWNIHKGGSLIHKKGILRLCDYQSVKAQMLFMMRASQPSLSKMSKCLELEEKVMSQVEKLRINLA
jgi:succinoglycan biosynthesis protein ExoV